MNLEAEKVRVIEQVLAVQDVELMNELRRLIDEAVQEFDYQHGLLPVMRSEAELLARLDSADEDIKNGHVLTKTEAATHLRNYTKR